MELPVPVSYQGQTDYKAGGVHTSPSSSSNISPQTTIPPPSNAFTMSAPTRNNFITPMHQPQLPPRSPGGYNPSSYGQSFGQSSVSPSTASGSAQESHSGEQQPPPPPAAGISPTQLSQISSTSLNAQKRAYRQRRKDPSCDACRERKVKCDATETSPCSECSSRSHKCQFTKETNRRMSSIKQVQDLQSQLAEAKNENNHLRSILQEGPVTNADRRAATSVRKSADSMSGPEPTPKPPVLGMQDFDHVRRNLRIHGGEIFRPPPFYRHSTQQPLHTPALPPLPQREIVDCLLRQYMESIHKNFPVLHWASFHQEVDQVYHARSFEAMPRAWVSLFFAILACGTLQDTEISPSSATPEATRMSYVNIASQALGSWPDDLVLDHAKVALLVSIFYTENNMESPGSVWLGCAVRIAQDLGLHQETGPWPVIEGEIRRRVFWAIYAWDRLLSLELGRPTLIDDGDCEVAEPSPVDDRFIQPQSIIRTPTSYAPYAGLSSLLPVARLISPLRKSLRASSIPPETLRSYNEYFQQFPDTYQAVTETWLDTDLLPAVMALQMMRFRLYRRNLSPVCHPTERAEALHSCVSISHDTAKHIVRSMQSPKPSASFAEDSWHTRVRQVASNMLCTHLWRCMLVSCLVGEYNAALTCVRLSSAIGNLRRINNACGRYMIFFLERLLEKTMSKNMSLSQLQHDEEMLAYVSGDMQGELAASWAWVSSDQGPNHSHVSGTGAFNHGPLGSIEPYDAGADSRATRDWGGWERVEALMQRLVDGQRMRQFKQPPPPTKSTSPQRLPFQSQQPPSPAYYHRPSHNPDKRLQLAPDRSTTVSPSAQPPVQKPSPPAKSSRISIANII